VATHRDLVEAHSFNRRRLVTAFVSGGRGGREIEPGRTGRPVAGGLALAVLLAAGAAVSGALQTQGPADGDRLGDAPSPTARTTPGPDHLSRWPPPSPPPSPRRAAGSRGA
jgi:hypothetical protein